MYWSGPLSVAQSMWHPFEQELYGLLHTRRQVVKYFGRIPVILLTDHATITRIEYLPIERIEAKHFRWFAELTAGGSKLVYRPGTSKGHQVPDGLSAVKKACVAVGMWLVILEMGLVESWLHGPSI